MTDKFVPLLLKSGDPRLLFIASGTSSMAGTDVLQMPINQIPPKGWPKSMNPGTYFPAYRSSKAGMNMMMRSVVSLLFISLVLF
jgi:NAD(P)-dependent dehydrogenase (short-subunit alcohol dehydrogenase family)